MSTDWKSKFSSFGEAIVDILLEGVILAVWLLVTFGLAILTKVTIGRQFSQLEDRIISIALLIVAIVGSLELIVSITIRTYLRLRREINDARST